MPDAMDHRAGLAALADIISQRLDGLADPTNGFALLDFPDYSNVGDSLIWLGELAYFDKRAGRRPDYVCTTAHFDAAKLQATVPDGPIYLSGGGNFGDLWPKFQEFRYDVLEAAQGRRVIQLPQTIFFQHRDQIARTRSAIRAHGDFVLMVRDQRSYDLATTEFPCEVLLCPDMAFCMGPQDAGVEIVRDVTCLVRTDQEAAASRGDAMLGSTGQRLVTDWLLEHPKRTLASRIAGRLHRLLPISPEAAFRRTAQSERARGMVILGAGKVIVTDRLHGHILSLLLGRPQVVVDNSYGKVHGFIDAWTKDFTTVHTASTLEEADHIARRLVAGIVS